LYYRKGNHSFFVKGITGTGREGALRFFGFASQNDTILFHF